MAKPQIEDANETKQFEESLRSLKTTLDGQAKRTIKLRQLSKEEGGPLHDETVCINGLIYQIMRGVEVEVPQSVYEVLEQAGRLG